MCAAARVENIISGNYEGLPASNCRNLLDEFAAKSAEAFRVTCRYYADCGLLTSLLNQRCFSPPGEILRIN